MHNASAEFDGRWWSILYETSRGEWGWCDYENRRIYIEPNADNEMKLDTLLHEAMHASMPFLCDTVVERAATELRRLLWEQGYRPAAED